MVKNNTKKKKSITLGGAEHFLECLYQTPIHCDGSFSKSHRCSIRGRTRSTRHSNMMVLGIYYLKIFSRGLTTNRGAPALMKACYQDKKCITGLK